MIWRVTAYHSVLAREISEQRPAQGDRIGIRYQGQVEGGRGLYESYRVAVEHPAQPALAIDWDAIGKAADAELGTEAVEVTDDQGERF